MLVGRHLDRIAPGPELEGEAAIGSDQVSAGRIGTQVVTAAGELQEALRGPGRVLNDITLGLELDIQPGAGAHDLRIDDRIEIVT